jgi:hypothetical protein
MTYGVHPKKEVRDAVGYAKDHGWDPQPGGSHRWGILWCPAHIHFVTVWSTPKDPGNHAKAIRRAVDRCDH